MVDEKYRIIDLIKRHFTDEITNEEKIFLNNWLGKSEKNKQFCKSIFDNLDNIKKEYEFINVEKAIEKFERDSNWHRIHLKKKMILYAAAIILPIISLLPFYRIWLPAKNTEYPIILSENKSVSLIMDDGSKLLLSKNEDINLQYLGVNLTNSNGLLTYRDTSGLDTPIRYNILEVPKGGEYRLELTDKTTIYLSAHSTLKYPLTFSENERRIFLEGEAYFTVEPDDKPFIVETNLGEIHVLGTSFGVTYFPDDEKLSTVLVSGSILYARQDTIILEPGERLLAYNNGTIQKDKVNVDEYIGWTMGKFIFYGHTLMEIMKEFQRWYDITFTFHNPKHKEIQFDINIDRYDSIIEFLELLKGTGEINYTINGKHIEFY